MRKTRVVADFATLKRIEELLNEHLTCVDPDLKLYAYDADWDDGRVAEEVGGIANRAHVNTFRQTYFGKVKRSRLDPPSPSVNDLRALVSDVKRDVDFLSKAFQDILVRIEFLEGKYRGSDK